MCGLVGVASIVPERNRQWLKGARDMLAHRGPDGFGEWWSEDGRVGLAHRRLAVIDPSPLGQQPMHLISHGLAIVFNGEIYNFLELRLELEQLGHRFRSNSDTEVLLAAYAQWGMDSLPRLNGMFAFALYDSVRGVLCLARDRVGEKPLFYRLERDRLYFASELKALFQHPDLPKQLDFESLDCYLSMGYVPSGKCILRGYNKLPPAHAMTFSVSTGATQLRRYWKLPEMASVQKFADENMLLKELELLLENAVARQLVADVPVGVLLSGGVDSSLVTAMAVRRSSKVRTFSIGFPGHAKFDETTHARLIARHFRTEHIELMAEPSSADLLYDLVRQFDEPMVDSSMFPTYLVSRLVRAHCTVALGGDGADELFGGYGHYERLLWTQRYLGHVPRFVRNLIARKSEELLPIGFKGRVYLQALAVDLRTELPLIGSYFDVTHRQRLLHAQSSHNVVAETLRFARLPHESDLLQRATRMDFENYLAEDILVKVDRASMLNSLEMRAPFLDQQVIEFAFGQVPSYLKATASLKKILLKKLAAKILPAEFDQKRKQGFSIPLADWLKRGPFRQLFWDTLTSADCMFDAKTVRDLLEGQDKGRSNGERLFALVQFELWRKIYRVSI